MAIKTTPSVHRKQRLAAICLALLLLLTLVAALLPQDHPEAKTDTFVAADLAWMLTASGLVLFMVPGLAFSTAAW